MFHKKNIIMAFVLVSEIQEYYLLSKGKSSADFWPKLGIRCSDSFSSFGMFQVCNQRNKKIYRQY